MKRNVCYGEAKYLNKSLIFSFPSAHTKPHNVRHHHQQRHHPQNDEGKGSKMKIDALLLAIMRAKQKDRNSKSSLFSRSIQDTSMAFYWRTSGDAFPNFRRRPNN
jgi:hypothetical protein